VLRWWRLSEMFDQRAAISHKTTKKVNQGFDISVISRSSNKFISHSIEILIHISFNPLKSKILIHLLNTALSSNTSKNSGNEIWHYPQRPSQWFHPSLGRSREVHLGNQSFPKAADSHTPRSIEFSEAVSHRVPTHVVQRATQVPATTVK
jgi:hypothetical protein